MTAVQRLLARGVAAGGIAGLAAGLFGFVVSEPTIDRAVRLEQARQRAAGEPADDLVEVFTRSTQHLGLVVAATVTGVALGVLFAMVYRLVYRSEDDGWTRALRLAGAAFVGLWLLPFLRYPGNPPGAGDPATLDQRTRAWFTAMAIGLVAVVAAWRSAAWLANRNAPDPLRDVAAVGIMLAALVVAFLALPASPDRIDVPATLLWDFRLLSVASALILWVGLGAAFGFLTERAQRSRPEAFARQPVAPR